MGYDPMTHRPRTDIFSSLPHLIALANLKELVDNHSWEEQAVRLQAEAAQMAKLQYLQYLLQPLASNGTPTQSINSFSDMETISLLSSFSSIKDNLGLSAHQLGTPTPSLGTSALQPVHDSIPFSHLPDLQIPCTYQTPVNQDNSVQAAEFTAFSQGENSPNSPWLASSSSTPSPSVAPPMTETSINNFGDACSTSSYGGAAPSIWPDLLLEDLLFHKIS